jgi:hypothetical protein
MDVLSRFDELRIKTDRQLLQLVDDTLARGIREAGEALMTAEALGFAQACHFRAKAAYAEAFSLIPLLGAIPDDERRQRPARLERLREMLDALSVLGSRTIAAGDKVPVLARALWKARDCPDGSPEEDWFRAEQALKSQPACLIGS